MRDRRTPARPTLADVAEVAGTSTAVVSWVVNNSPRPVAAQTRERVRAAVEQLGYRPNRIAQALASRESKTLGLVVPDTTNAFFRDLSRSVEAAAFRAGLLTLIGNAALSPEHEVDYIQAFVDANVDGLIVATTANEFWNDALIPPSIPFVCLHKRIDTSRGLLIRAADRAGGRSATQHLVEHGHSNPWCLAGPDEPGPLADRLQGWRDVVEESTSVPADSRIIRSRTSALDAADALKQALRTSNPPRALFAVTDEQALGALHAIDQAGLRIPDDIAIVGMDGTTAGVVSVPPLTTVKLPIDAMAQAAVDVASTGSEADLPGVFPADLVIRQSCGCN